MTPREQIAEYHPELIVADGLDDAIIGVTSDCMHVVYSVEGCIQAVIHNSEGLMSRAEAIEYLEFNTFCAYVGENTPIYVDLLYPE
jgi:hypothetical protein